MKLRHFILTAALVLAGCFPTSYQARREEVKPRPAGVLVDHALTKQLSAVSARFVVKEKVGYFFDGKDYHDIYQTAWTGSAFCIDIVEKPAKGPKYSVWLTCRHVADTRALPVPGKTEIDFKDKYGNIAFANAYDITVSDKYDIAMFKSYGIPAGKLTLATDNTINHLALGDYLIAVGHPGGMFPAAITVGAFIGFDAEQQDIRFTTPGTYGSSGSPIIDARTMTVLGVVYKFAGAKYRGGYRSDDLKAVSASNIRKAFFSK